MQDVPAARSGKRFTAKDIVLTALFAVVMAICSWISIPMQVPFTLQTFGVFCALALLGGRRGFFSVAVYLALGAVGAPVFAEFSGGMGALLGATGGYLWGFLAQALLYWAAEKWLPDKPVFRISAMVAGLIACYAFGTAWFVVVYTHTASAVDVGTALSWCVIPFLIPDLLKLVLALILSRQVKKYVRI